MMHEVLEGASLDKAEANAKEESRDPVQWCDHLYLDLNGIVHPCCHPEDGQPLPKDEDEMLTRVEAHLDRLMELMRPRCRARVSRRGCTSLDAVRLLGGPTGSAARCTLSLCNNYDLCAVSLVTGASNGLWRACSPACAWLASVLLC